MSDRGPRLRAEHLSEAAFRPFGRVVAPPERAPDATGPGWRWWGETLALPAESRRYGVGALDLAPTHHAFDWAERHMHSVEAVVPLGADCLFYVGPPEAPHEPAALPSLDSFKVFVVPVGRGVVIDRGVWHGAPLAVDEPTAALVLLLEGTGATDTTVVRFADTPVTIALDG